jgi:hypothetical protein
MAAISRVSSSRQSQVTREAKERDWELSQTWQKPPSCDTGPSIVPHPDRSDLPPGSRRFILSLRATAEGHVSSITFRTGLLDANNNSTIATPPVSASNRCRCPTRSDRDDPTEVIGRLGEPLTKPDKDEREGYLLNVVYSCGSLPRGGQLIIPDGMSDYATTLAAVSLDEVLAAIQ